MRRLFGWCKRLMAWWNKPVPISVGYVDQGWRDRYRSEQNDKGRTWGA